MSTADKLKTIADNIPKVYEAGQAQGEREMWDAITANNTRKDISMLFVESNFEYIRPPYKIIPTESGTLNQPFAGAKNLKKVEFDYFDFSQKKTGTYSLAGCYYTFYNCSEIEEIEDLGIQPEFGYYTTYANCTKLKKIAVIRSNENTKYNGEVFNYCYALKEVRFEGVIGQNGLNFQWSDLTIGTLENIVFCLQDKSTDTSGTVWKVKVGSKNYAKLTEELLQEIERKGWIFE